MAIPEACEVWIEQRIDEELDAQRTTGYSFREIGRRIGKEIEQLFETKINDETMASRVKRAAGSNEPPQENNETPDSNDEIKEIKRAKDGTLRGGARPGSGRKKNRGGGGGWFHVERTPDELIEYMKESCSWKEIPIDLAVRISEHIGYLNTVDSHSLQEVKDGKR